MEQRIQTSLKRITKRCAVLDIRAPLSAMRDAERITVSKARMATE